MIDYEHAANQHTVSGPIAAIPHLFSQRTIVSVLDVGCGTGTWLRAVLQSGIQDVMGIDGVSIPREQLLIPPTHFRVQDLTKAWNLDRRFDAVLCLEVAEHLNPSHAETLIHSIVLHADIVFFSAAAPEQPGQHHVNCQWPVYWQRLFNDCGFACDDSIRWQMWNDERIEPWYRQNIFCAERAPGTAGKEPRIPAVIHPNLAQTTNRAAALHSREALLSGIHNGQMPVGWYLRAPFTGLFAKLFRRLKSVGAQHGSHNSAAPKSQ